MYCDYLNYWYSNVGDGLFAHFSSHGGYNQFGSWGIKENYEDMDSPKYQALINCVFSQTNISTADVILTDNCIELLADEDENVFILQGDLSSYSINVYDAFDNWYQNYNTGESELIINSADIPSGLHYVKIEHFSNPNIYLTQIVNL